jgi:hypothetical protein
MKHPTNGVESREQRRARLLPDYAPLYPDIPPDVWLPAGRVAFLLARRVARAHRSAGSLPDRILDPRYFEFTGGANVSRSARARSRATDTIQCNAGVVARCEGCGAEAAVADQEGPDGAPFVTALRGFLRRHARCRERVRQGPFLTLRENPYG